jgi:microcystin-dependent protein
MADPFLGEIRVFPFNFAPVGWALCNGQVMSISQNTALFSLLGTQFGGNGQSTFALPNFQGCFSMGQGNGPGLTPRSIGESDGETAVTLLLSDIPVHTHSVECNVAANQSSPANAIFSGAGRGKPPAYAAASGATVNMNATAVGSMGSSQPHNNLPPYLTMNFCIALQGIYPARD